MKNISKLVLLIGFLVLSGVSWTVILSSQTITDDDIQSELVSQAEEFLLDEVYILALPLLEEAVKYETEDTTRIENLLKEVYLQLIDQGRNRIKYYDLLVKQMRSDDAHPQIYIEAASFQLANDRLNNALSVLREGISKTNDNGLIDMYEAVRYQYRLESYIYEDVTAIYGNTIGVSIDGLWGIARSNGRLIIPCEYIKVSTFSADRAIVLKNINGATAIYAVDSQNNRLALYRGDAFDFGNFAANRLSILVNNKWHRTTGEFEFGSETFDWIGTHSNNYAAAQVDGKWGVIDRGTAWLIPPEFDGVVVDELGRSYAQDSVFILNDGCVNLYVNGVKIEESYDDARPFNNQGFAAVKRGGLWGYINNSGNVEIDFKYEDALSFDQYLAAVKIGDYWGYISLRGEIVIEPIFIQAKSFSNGSAPVLTERGWQFITLIENIER